jgi:hypothetical protein
LLIRASIWGIDFTHSARVFSATKICHENEN